MLRSPYYHQRQNRDYVIIFCYSFGACGSLLRSMTPRRLQLPWSKSAAFGSCSSCAHPLLQSLNNSSLTHRLILAHSYPETFKVCLSAADVEAATTSHPPKIASLIGMEGGHSIGGSIDTLTAMYRFQSHFTQFFGIRSVFLLCFYCPTRYKAGARYMTLTHSVNNAWADSATDAARLV